MINKTGKDAATTTKKKVATKKSVSKQAAVKKKVASKAPVTNPAPVTKKAPVTNPAPVTKKAPVAKKAAPAVKEKVASKPAEKPVISPRERYEMIATRAYYRAEQRNFAPGNEEQDWYECEQIVDEMLGKK